MKKIVRFNKLLGYTLIELIIAFGILSIIGGIVLSILTTSFRTSGKTQEIDSIRQNGDYAISQIEKTLRFAQSLDGVSNDGATYVDCTNVRTGELFLKIGSFSPPPNNRTIFACTASTVQSNGVSLLDTSAVKTISCAISCVPDPSGGSPTVGFRFTLQPITSSSTPPIEFQTSITLRNIQ